MDRPDLLQLLHEQKFRLTREREEVLALFRNSTRLFTPAELHAVAQESGVQVGLTTVYRLLEVLTKVGLATPFLIQGTIYYTYCAGHHHHHFVCLTCHRVENIYECPTFHSLPEQCTVDYHKVDLYGRCKACDPLQADTHPVS